MKFDNETVRPPFDPEIEAALEQIADRLPKLSEQNLSRVREMSDANLGVEPVDLTAGGRVDFQEVLVPGPEGSPDLVLLVLRPATSHGSLPGIYFVHGGGMVAGNRTSGLQGLLPYVAEGLAVGVSVEYRLAPENPHPAPVEDCYAGLVWTAEHSAELSIDPDRIAIVGVSAGGGLAAACTLLSRDRGFPKLSDQILLSPMLDDRIETASAQMLRREGFWSREDNLFGWTALLGDKRGTDDVPAYAAPARAQDLSGLPRTFIDIGSVDTFRDEVLDYARRLSEAGVNVDLHMWGGGCHGFDDFAPDAAISRASLSTRDEYFRRLLAG